MEIIKLIQKKLEAAAPSQSQKEIVKWMLPVAIACVALVHFLRHLLPTQNLALITLMQIVVFLLVVGIAFFLLYSSSLKTIRRLEAELKSTLKNRDELADGIASYILKYGESSKPPKPKTLEQLLNEQLSSNS